MELSVDGLGQVQWDPISQLSVSVAIKTVWEVCEVCTLLEHTQISQ